MTSDLPFLSREVGERTVLSVQQDNLDFRSCEALKQALSELMGDGVLHVVLDLSRVKFMDSSGLSALLYGQRLAEEHSGSFGLCGLFGYVSNLILATNLSQTLTVHPPDWETSAGAPGD